MMRFKFWQGAVILVAAAVIFILQFGDGGYPMPKGAAPMPPPTYSVTDLEGGDVELIGRVVMTDQSQLPLDGDGIVTVDVGGFRRIDIRVPTRESLCEAADQTLNIDEIAVRDEIGARGRKNARGDVVVCRSEDHYLRKSGSSGRESLAAECGPEPPALCGAGLDLQCDDGQWSCVSDGTEYVACGCGCCGGLDEADAKATCLYLSEGDDLQTIIDQDKAIAMNEAVCAVVGCSFPIRYRYCDEKKFLGPS